METAALEEIFSCCIWPLVMELLLEVRPTNFNNNHLPSLFQQHRQIQFEDHAPAEREEWWWRERVRETIRHEWAYGLEMYDIYFVTSDSTAIHKRNKHSAPKITC
jgi:hypothetical protein